MESKQPEERSGLQIPLWVALAGMVLALIIAVIIMANVLRPLINLVFPSKPKLALPADVIELKKVEKPRTSDGEWLYGVNMDGCQLAKFYMDQGATCNFAPFICDGEGTDFTNQFAAVKEVQSIGTCELSKSGVADSFSWQMLISTGYDDYLTKYRVYLYRERK